MWVGDDFSMIFDDFLKKNRRVLQLFAFLTTEGGLVQKMWVGDDFSMVFRIFLMIY